MGPHVTVLPQGMALQCCEENSCPCLPEILWPQDYSKSRWHYETEMGIHLSEIAHVLEALQSGGPEWTLLYFPAKNLLYYTECGHDVDNSCRCSWNSKMVVKEWVLEAPLVLSNYGVKKQNCVDGLVEEERAA